MLVELPIFTQELVDDKIITKEKTAAFDVDTSIYSEERWEQNFPELAKREGLFQYIERIDKSKDVSERVRVSAMLKAVYCFLESKEIPTYKSFAQLFSVSAPEYTQKLIDRLTSIFKQILNGSATKNL